MLRSTCFLFFLIVLQNGAAQKPQLIEPIGHTNVINMLQYSADGEKLLTASADFTAKIWDVSSGRLLKELKGHRQSVEQAIYSNTGKFILTIGRDKKAMLWDQFGILLSQYDTRDDPVSGVFSENDSLLAIGDVSGSIKIITLSDKAVKKNFDVEGRLSHLFLTKKHELIAAADLVSKIDLKSDETKTLIHTRASGAAVHLASNRLALFNTTFLRIIQLDSGEELIEKEVDKYYGDNFKFSANGNWLLNYGSKTVSIWDAKVGEVVYEHNTPGYVRAADFLSGDTLFMAASLDGTISIRQLTDSVGKLEFKMKNASTGAISPDGTTLAVSDYDNVVKLWSLPFKLLLSEMRSNSQFIINAQLSRNGEYMTLITETGIMRLIDVKTSRAILDLPFKAHKANFSPDSKFLASAGDSIRVWDIESQKSFSIDNKGRLSGTVIFSPDSRYLLSGDQDTAARIWDRSTGKMVGVLKGHRNRLTSVYYSADGRFITTSSRDSSFNIWNASTGKLVRRIREPATILTVSCSPNGNLFAVALPGKLHVRNQAGDLISSFDVNLHAGMFNQAGTKVYCYTRDRSVVVYDIAGKLAETSVPLGDFTPVDILNDLERISAVDHSEVALFSGSGSLLYSNYQTPKGNFTMTPQGYYFSHPEVADQLHYVTEDLKIISFDQLDLVYNRPDKVLRAIGNSDTALITSFEKAYLKRIKRLKIDTTQLQVEPPSLVIRNSKQESKLTGSGSLTLDITATSEIHELTSFNIWVNEVPLYGTRGITLAGSRTKLDTVLNVTLENGKNTIYATVTNTAGIESFKMPLVIYSTVKPTVEKLHFIGIGINKFHEPGHDLNWSVKDIRDLASALKKKYGNDISIDTLFDQNVSVANVVALKKKLLNSSINDKVIVAYSGHGLLSNDFDYYLSTYNVDFKQPEKDGLPYELLEGLLDSIPARQKLMLIDACHSGEVDKEEMEKYVLVEKTLEDSGTKSGRKPIPADGKLGMKNSFELMQELFVNVGRSTGATVISAAAGTQFAQEKGDLQNGVFTYSILEYMKHHPTATVSELRQYVNKRVSELTQGMQVPTTRSETRAVDWSVW